MNNTAESNQTIDLRHVWKLIKEGWLQILLWTIILAAAGYAAATFVMQPKFSSTAQILVNQKSSRSDPNAAYTQQQANVQLVNTYKDIITSPVIVKDASKYLANPVTLVKPAKKAVYKEDSSGKRVLVKPAQKAVYRREAQSFIVSSSQLQGALSVQTQQNSQVFSLVATADSPEKSKAIANSVAKVFKEKIPKIMNVNNVTIVSSAQRGEKSFPKPKLFALAGAILGIVISLAIILIKDAFNTTVRSDDFMMKELGLTNLGTIIHFRYKRESTNGKNDGSSKTNRRV